MPDRKIVKQSLTYAAGAIVYVILVVTMLNVVQKMSGSKPDSPLAPVGFLLLLVVSVATMGMLIFGKPVMLYIDGKKREGVTMAMTTIASLAVFTILLFVFFALRG